MAHVEWSAGIDAVSGALSKPSKRGQHSCNKMLLGTHRIAATTNNSCTRLYLRKKVKRSTLPSQHELDIRARFAAVSRAVVARRQNLATIATDQAAFVAQRDLADGKKTFTAYLWYVCGQAYDAQNP